jgi:protease-4
MALVDMLGDLDDAIEIAAEKAGVSDDYKVNVYPIQKAPLEELLESLSGEYESQCNGKRA